MATITPRERSAKVHESQERVTHPLQRLRGTIRSYVALEGAAAVVIFLTAVFWLGLAFDYGSFRLLTVDWVQVPGSWTLRAIVLALLGVALLAVVAVKVLLRLTTEFRDDSLALVLERRFPEQLGDRLITAVELADVKKAARYGYSSEMIEQTIIDAADRVEQVPVKEVFNWKRLRNLGVLVGVLLAAVYLLVGGGACLADVAMHRRASLGGFARLNDVAVIWVERNILLQNTIWPRRAFLEMLAFPESGELRISMDAPPPGLRVRALQWVWADSSAPEGWRALQWNDLHRSELLGDGAPPLPASWLKEQPSWSLDQVEHRLEELDSDTLLAVRRALLHAEEIAASPRAEGKRPRTWSELKQLAGDGPLVVPDLPATWTSSLPDPTLEQVEAKLKELNVEELQKLQELGMKPLRDILDSRRLKRQLRRLVIPEKVYVVSWGRSSGGTMTLQKQGNNEYAGAFSDLKESIHFQVNGEDYYSRIYDVNVVPPPNLVTLDCEEWRPAYLYYRVPPGATAADLRGKRQLYQLRRVPVSGGASRLEVPAGSDLDMTATLDKELTTDPARPPRILPPRKGQVEVQARVEVLDSHRFRTRFDNIRQKLDFVFEFTDSDGVVGLRQVIITPLEDTPPEADIQVEVVRKTNQGYMVSTKAAIPFSGRVLDRQALERVDHVCRLTKLDTAAEAGDKFRALLLAMFGMAGGPGQELAGAAMVLAQLRELARPGDDRGWQSVPVSAFAAKLKDRAPAETLPLARMAQRLKHPNVHPQERTLADLTRDFEFRPDDPAAAFDLLPLQLTARSQDETQPRYRMQLRVEAADNDVETGPHTSQSKETFTFVIVSENELITEVAKEEESLHLKLDDVNGRLLEGRAKLDQVLGDLGQANLKEDDFRPMSVRSEEIERVLERTLGMTTDVLNDYDRILRELQVNRVRKELVDRKEKTVRNPLEEIIRQAFPRAQDGLVEFRKLLDEKADDLAAKTDRCRKGGAEARERMQVLLDRLKGVLDNMAQIMTINTLIKQLRMLEDEQNKQYDLFGKLKKELEDKILKGLFDDEPPKKP